MIKEEFESVIANYLLERRKDFAGNWIAQKIRIALPTAIENQASLSDEYLIQGSSGMGNWAEVPWICIFDKEITKSARTGYYVVYLFSSDMSGVYISLNQGWTQYEIKYGKKEGLVKIRQNAEKFQNFLRTTLSDFNFEPINLEARNTLGQGYESGHICGKLYPKDKIPEDIIITNDLRNILSVYREMKGLVGNEIFDLDFVLEPVGEDDIVPTEKEKLYVNKALSKVKTIEEIELALQRFEDEYKSKEPKIRKRIATAIARNARVAKLIKEKADFRCEICYEEGFFKENGERYAEVHHKEELAKSRLDIPSNLICVCPRCHRIIHYGSKVEIEKLSTKQKGVEGKTRMPD